MKNNKLKKHHQERADEGDREGTSQPKWKASTFLVLFFLVQSYFPIKYYLSNRFSIVLLPLLITYQTRTITTIWWTKGTVGECFLPLGKWTPARFPFIISPMEANLPLIWSRNIRYRQLFKSFLVPQTWALTSLLYLSNMLAGMDWRASFVSEGCYRCDLPRSL